jgi:hypothetical protein
MYSRVWLALAWMGNQTSWKKASSWSLGSGAHGVGAALQVGPLGLDPLGLAEIDQAEGRAVDHLGLSARIEPV